MKQKHILLLFGGESSEHEVSIESARNAYEAINKEKFEVTLTYISRDGVWTLVDQVADYGDSANTRQIIPILGRGMFLVQEVNETISPDLILPILHGKNGEDGSVQALATLLHIPVVGCDLAASALCMDKVSTKRIAMANEIPVAEFVTHHSGVRLPDYEALTNQLGNIMFVKPARAGSSVGVSKVKSPDEFEKAINDAHIHDEVIIIERAIAGREIEVAVLGNPPDINVSDVGEIKPDGDFYSYESKYDSSSTSQIIIPAEVSDVVRNQIQEYAKVLFIELGCRGMARVDFFLEGETAILSEVNTIPGFTNISMYPKLWLASGMTYPELVEKLITLATMPDTIEV